jgi:peptide/nickel transport system ATP-binding protein
MYVGRVVEVAPTQKLYQQPQHPYTEALLSSIPKPDPKRNKQRIAISGEIPNPANPPSGCHFHPRCPYAQPICAQESPPLREITPGQFAACHFSESLNLKGVNDF